MNYKPTHILARLETGFRTGAAHLSELEKDLIATLQRARHFGKKHGPTDEWQTLWHQQWDKVEAILHRTRVLLNQMQHSVESRVSGRNPNALAAWENMQLEDAQLVKALGAIRAQASALDANVRKDWNVLAHTVEPYLETLYACVQTLRVRWALLEKHSKEEVDELMERVLAKLPTRTQTNGMDAETYQRGYDKAAIELEQEQHEYLGFLDVVQALSMWVESPDERLQNIRSLTVDED